MEHNRGSLRAEGILLFTTLLWGGTFTVTKLGLESISPFMLIAMRFGLAFVVFTACTHRRLISLTRLDIQRGCILGFLMFAGYGLQTAGLALTTVAKSSLFTYTFAIYVPPLQYLLSGRKVRIGTAIGIGLSLAGVFVFASPDSSGFNTGDLLTLLSAFAFGWQIVLLDLYAKKSDPVKLTSVQFFCIALAGVIVALVTGQTDVVLSIRTAGAVGYLAVAGSVVAIYLMNRFQKETTPAKAVVIYAMEPVFSVVIGIIILGEVVGARELVGGALIVSGVIVSELWSMLRPAGRVYEEPS